MPFLRSKISRCLFCAVPLLVITIFTYWLHTLSGTTLGTSSFFVMTSLRTLIPLLFAIIILPDLFGYQSPLKTLFESSTCNLLSKLSLSLYAVHYSVQLFLVYHRQSDL